MSKPVQIKSNIENAVSEAFGEFESLSEEMRSWAESLEEKFSNTTKYETVSNTADTLEGLSIPDVGGELSNIEVVYQNLPVKKKGYSRADRCGQACYILDQCISALEEFIDEAKDGEAKDAAEGLKDDIDNAKGEAEGAEFPGMYG